MYLSDLLKQYEKINIQQHFGKTTIDEMWYIESIITFIKNAFENLPNELSAIIKKSDFNIKIKNPEIGVLRLQPKILKLKQIDHSNVEKLTSRGIKSSMNDPIKVIQKILEKIFSHLLFYIEQEFHNKFSTWSPSVLEYKKPSIELKNLKLENGDPP